MEKAQMRKRIESLKRERKAVILAHTYQPEEIQEIADFVGDSYGLSVKASRLDDADVVVFCGVRFMAETAAILNPLKTVLLPDETAGCPMAEMITAEEVRRFKERHPGAPAVCYVNSTAEVKAECDVCCTSSNAEKVIRSLAAHRDILFLPDQYLGKTLEGRLKRGLVLWDGCCPIHQGLTAEALEAARKRHPQAEVMVHPECRPEAQAVADHVLSTGQMLELVKASGCREFIVGTECGILSALRKACPEKQFHAVEPVLVCGDMKKITLEKVVRSLETLTPRVTVPSAVAERARRSIEAMLSLGA
jgi:quinolinate synthase